MSQESFLEEAGLEMQISKLSHNVGEQKVLRGPTDPKGPWKTRSDS